MVHLTDTYIRHLTIWILQELLCQAGKKAKGNLISFICQSNIYSLRRPRPWLTIGCLRMDALNSKVTKFSPTNIDIINKIQSGMMCFCEKYFEYLGCTNINVNISPYLASGPIREAIGHPEYCNRVYGDFIYDASAAVMDESSSHLLFKDLFPQEARNDVITLSADLGREHSKDAKRVLFISPEMIYTGAPRSLLRICKVTKEAGYEVSVWTAKSGPFEREFSKEGIIVETVPESRLNQKETKDRLLAFDVVVCNTIVTDAYVRACGNKVPVVWYIREATNIPDFCMNNPLRLATLRNSLGITCVSDYAAHAISEFTDMPISVVRNAVEDISHWAHPYSPAKNGIVRFLQMGTIEYRKGYDILIEAYKKLPQEYKDRCEIYFAGGFIASAASFCSYLFNEVKDEPGIHYLGQITDEQKKIEVMSQMDAIVVASRDESCSLVALEGAMLSKPLILTENVGAKYIVDDASGFVAKSGDISSLRACMMNLIDQIDHIAILGHNSRTHYEAMASMEAHKKDIISMLERAMRSSKTSHFLSRQARRQNVTHRDKKKDSGDRDNRLVVSLTSHPGRISTVAACIRTLLNQSMQADKVLLWLSEEQFPSLDADLPDELSALRSERFEIRWCTDDLKPHKKYYYTMKEYADSIIIIVDDDVKYDHELIERLFDSYQKHPHAISCMRANLMLFRPNGLPRTYDNWVYDYKMLKDRPTYQLLPTGVGGVLYPPNSLPDEAFDSLAIKENALFCDDLWLKVFSTKNGFPTVLVGNPCGIRTIEGTQEVGLWRENSGVGRNDVALKAILEHYEASGWDVDRLLRRIRCVGDDGAWIGPDDVSYLPLE